MSLIRAPTLLRLRLAPCRRLVHSSALCRADTPSVVHAVPKVSAGFIHQSLGVIPDDPLPDRPPEDDIAVCTAYFDTLVALLHHTNDLPAVMMRIARLKEPRNWVNVLHVFSARRKRVPEVLAFIEARFLCTPTPVDTFTFEAGKSVAADGTVLTTPFDALDAQYLAALAFAAYAQGSTNKAFFQAIAGRLATFPAVPESAMHNITSALQYAGVPLPDNVKADKETYELQLQ